VLAAEAPSIRGNITGAHHLVACQPKDEQLNADARSTGSAAAEELNGAPEGGKARILVLADVVPRLLTQKFDNP